MHDFDEMFSLFLFFFGFAKIAKRSKHIDDLLLNTVNIDINTYVHTSMLNGEH